MRSCSTERVGGSQALSRSRMANPSCRQLIGPERQSGGGSQPAAFGCRRTRTNSGRTRRPRPARSPGLAAGTTPGSLLSTARCRSASSVSTPSRVDAGPLRQLIPPDQPSPGNHPPATDTASPHTAPAHSARATATDKPSTTTCGTATQTRCKRPLTNYRERLRCIPMGGIVLLMKKLARIALPLAAGLALAGCQSPAATPSPTPSTSASASSAANAADVMFTQMMIRTTSRPW